MLPDSRTGNYLRAWRAAIRPLGVYLCGVYYPVEEVGFLLSMFPRLSMWRVLWLEIKAVFGSQAHRRFPWRVRLFLDDLESALRVYTAHVMEGKATLPGVE
jgi:hypothetical protein